MISRFGFRFACGTGTGNHYAHFLVVVEKCGVHLHGYDRILAISLVFFLGFISQIQSSFLPSAGNCVSVARFSLPKPLQLDIFLRQRICCLIFSFEFTEIATTPKIHLGENLIAACINLQNNNYL